jgi:hypothetical protein
VSILIQFLLRASFGLAVAMAITPPRKVTSGFYRNHLYVILGMCVLAALAALSLPEGERTLLPLIAAGLSYAGAVAWLYEKRRLGVALLAVVATVALVGDWQVAGQLHEPRATSHEPRPVSSSEPLVSLLRFADPPTAGLLLGSVLGAMFLGHWYLNTPTMELGPLRRLLVLVAVATIARAVVCGAGAMLQFQLGGPPPIAFVVLRWLAGLIGVGAMAGMAWQTLKIPNTQSATGILYVAVIGVFIGELTSQLLSAHTLFPL